MSTNNLKQEIMRNLIYLFVGLLAGLSSATAKNLDDTSINRYYDGSRYIFVEGGVEFSVYPDGEFDFVLTQIAQGVNVNVNAGPVNISYNSGFNYDPFFFF